MLDPVTLFFVLCALFFLAAAVLGVAWMIEKTVPGVGLWALGRFFIAMGLGFVALRPVIDLGLSVMVGNGLLFLGLYAVLRGNQSFMGRTPYPRWPFFLLFIISMSLLAYWSIVEVNFPSRVLVPWGMVLLFHCLSVVALWPRAGDHSFVTGKIVATVHALEVLISLFRISSTVAENNVVFFLDPDSLQGVFIFISIIASMLTTTGYLAMMTEYLQRKLKVRAESEAFLNEKLRYEIETKDRFFSIISHDLVSPFNSLLTMTQMMSHTNLHKETSMRPFS